VDVDGDGDTGYLMIHDKGPPTDDGSKPDSKICEYKITQCNAGKFIFKGREHTSFEQIVQALSVPANSIASSTGRRVYCVAAAKRPSPRKSVRKSTAATATTASDPAAVTSPPPSASTMPPPPSAVAPHQQQQQQQPVSVEQPMVVAVEKEQLPRPTQLQQPLQPALEAVEAVETAAVTVAATDAVVAVKVAPAAVEVVRRRSAKGGDSAAASELRASKRKTRAKTIVGLEIGSPMVIGASEPGGQTNQPPSTGSTNPHDGAHERTMKAMKALYRPGSSVTDGPPTGEAAPATAPAPNPPVVALAPRQPPPAGRPHSLPAPGLAQRPGSTVGAFAPSMPVAVAVAAGGSSGELDRTMALRPYIDYVGVAHSQMLDEYLELTVPESMVGFLVFTVVAHCSTRHQGPSYKRGWCAGAAEFVKHVLPYLMLGYALMFAQGFVVYYIHERVDRQRQALEADAGVAAALAAEVCRPELWQQWVLLAVFTVVLWAEIITTVHLMCYVGVVDEGPGFLAKSLLHLAVLIPKTLVAELLWYYGAGLITMAAGIEAMVVTTVVLTFVTQLDRYLYPGVVAVHMQHALRQLNRRPLRYRFSRHGCGHTLVQHSHAVVVPLLAVAAFAAAVLFPCSCPQLPANLTQHWTVDMAQVLPSALGGGGE
jgi:hypothetical protein